MILEKLKIHPSLDEVNDETKDITPKQNKKKSIPKALREQVWKKYCGEKFSKKCTISWCKNQINVFDFHVGHNIPESKGGETNISNLRPICSRCNLSMSNIYTIDKWNNLGNDKTIKKCGCFRFFLFTPLKI